VRNSVKKEKRMTPLHDLSLSSRSYPFTAGDGRFDAMMHELDELFTKYRQEGRCRWSMKQKLISRR